MPDGMAHMITDGTENLAGMIVEPEHERNKRSMKAEADFPSLGSAGSREESIRPQ
jgi:hypothetical protein